MRALKGRVTSAHALAIAALMLAVGGGSFAGAALDGPDKKVVKKLAKKQANKQIKKKGPKLSVRHAATADTASSAGVAEAVTPAEPVHFVGQPGEPPFQGGWHNAGDDTLVGFFKDKAGIVHLQGLATGGGDLSRLFTLPPGYRPADHHFLPALDTGLSDQAMLRVSPSGEVAVLCEGGAASNCKDRSMRLSISGLTFRADG